MLAAAVAVVSFAPAAPARTYDVNHLPLPRLAAPAGRSVEGFARVGDFDGDGRGDLALLTSRAGLNTGRWWVGIVPARPQRGVRRMTLEREINLGWRYIPPELVPVGDVDGDGFADIAFTQRHRVWLVFGARGRTRTGIDRPGRRVMRINGLERLPRADVTVASAGDLNRDGRADLALGSPAASPSGREHAGSVYVVHGRAGRADLDVSDPRIAAARFDGPVAGTGAGAGLARIGDFDGDRRADLAVRGIREAWVVRARGPSHALGTSGDTSIMNAGDGRFEVNRIGDLDGDGRSDLGLGGTSKVGFLIFGGPRGEAVDLTTRGGRTVRFRVHATPRGAGDVNRDGRAELTVGGYLLLSGRRPLPPVFRPRHLARAAWHARYSGPLVPFGDLDGDGRTDFAASIDGGRYCWEHANAIVFLRGVLDPPRPPAFTRTTSRDDRLVGGPHGDEIYGDRGRDVLVGRGGADCLNGGADDGFTGPDDHFAAPRPDADRLRGGKGHDELVGGVSRDVLRGGRGRDRLYGESGRDLLIGGRGDDYLEGYGYAASPDRYRAGPGDDHVDSQDGVVQTVDCGPGRDAILADRRDRLTGCERVRHRRPL
jgi:hypothetical protein